MSEKPDLHKLTQELGEASARLAEFEKIESAARSDATRQRNEVNRLQREFDRAVTEIRNGAGNDTDWGVRRRSGQDMAAE